jgi:transposase
MIDKMKRQTIVTLHKLGKSCRHISKLLSISRNTVTKVLNEGVDPPKKEQNDHKDDFIPIIKTLFERVNGNVVRVQEILKADYDQDISYSTLTRITRSIDLRKAPERFGEYVFEPGQEMQHDTSPHKVMLDGKIIKAECASLVFGFSRKLYFQYYPRFTRFEAKAFLLAALKYMGGSCRRCVIDNTSVILASGSGADAIITPECANFGKIFGFTFFAHAIRHSNRKGKIERPFYFIETNFLAGREFKDWNDLNQQSENWCTTYANQKVKKVLGKNPETVFIQEKPYLHPLPEILPPVYEYCSRTVDSQGYVHLDGNRYSAPERLVDKSVDVYKYIDEVVINYKHEEVARHKRETNKTNQKIKAPGHHIQKTHHMAKHNANETTKVMLGQNEVLDAYIAEFKTRIRGCGLKRLNQLLYLKQTYPVEAFIAAIERAYTYGLYDLKRLEDLILKYIAGNVFNLFDGE